MPIQTTNWPDQARCDLKKKLPAEVCRRLRTAARRLRAANRGGSTSVPWRRSLRYESKSVPFFQSLLDESSSDDDDELILAAAQIVSNPQPARKHGRSVPGHIVLYRDIEGGHSRMYQNYLADDPTYTPTIFRQRLVEFIWYNWAMWYILILTSYYFY